MAADAAAGQRLRIRRTEVGVSQGAVAGRLGITFQQVHKYENGTNRLSGRRLQQLAEFLKVPVTYFFDDVGSAKRDPAKDIVRQMLLTRDGSKLLDVAENAAADAKESSRPDRDDRGLKALQKKEFMAARNAGFWS